MTFCQPISHECACVNVLMVIDVIILFALYNSLLFLTLFCFSLDAWSFLCRSHHQLSHNYSLISILYHLAQ